LLLLLPNQVKSWLPIWVQMPFAPAWRAPVSSTEIQGAVSSPARSTSRASARKPSWPAISSRITWRWEMSIPMARNCATSRATVTWPWWYCASTKRRNSGPKWPTMPAGSGAVMRCPAGVSQRSRRSRSTCARSTRSCTTKLW
jgi:hypothetical protein